jgi:hypothetical protein
MKLLVKIVLFLAVFSAGFALLRTSAEYRIVLAADLKDLGGVPSLYTTLGTIFSFLAAFVVQSGWAGWGGLVSAIRDEVNALDRLWHVSFWFPAATGARLRAGLRRYVELAIFEGWDGSRPRGDDPGMDRLLVDLGQAVVHAAAPREASFAASGALAELAGYRRERLHFATRKMPPFLRYTLILACTLVIALSLLIGVRSMSLDYIFTTSIALLAYVVYLLADDLDNPCRAGLWHVTPEEYQRLARKMDAPAAEAPLVAAAS